MKIKTLDIAGLRAFEQASFTFQAGLNLIVGVNGVGKTTTLDALRISLSKILPQITSTRSKKMSFPDEDIRIGNDSMTITTGFEIKDNTWKLVVHKQLESFIENDSTNLRNQTTATPDIEEFIPSIDKLSFSLKKSKTQTIAVYYSTKRSFMTDQKPSKAASSGGQAAAFAESLLDSRAFSLKEAAEWMNARETLGKELPKYKKQVADLQKAANYFLPNCNNLHAVREPSPKLMIEKDGKLLNVKQLSDGERGLLTIVLDLAKRLSFANPILDNPIKDGRAIVLIDELDLHLHPQWQRMVVERLITTFPNCQFIVTTHSPQIIGEVAPERITIISDNQVYQPDRSFGIDSSRILEELMDTKIRTSKVETQLNKLFHLIDEERLDEGMYIILVLESDLVENDPELTRAKTLIDFLNEDFYEND
jgi:predicted ATP-binding protein involved in virulence